MSERKMISIWIFIGALLMLYGVLIMGQGIWELFVPPEHPVVLGELRAPLWWGSLLMIIGAAFVGKNSRW